MQAAILFIGIIMVITIAVIFFGIMGNGSKKQSPITDMLGTETFFNDIKMRDSKKRYVIYVSAGYEKLRMLSENDNISRANRYIRRHILNLCSEGRGKAAKVDGNNYIAVAECESRDIKKFCTDILNEDNRLADDTEISMGIYQVSDDINFKTAAGYAKKISRQAKNTDDKYFICNKNTLSDIIEKDTIEKNIEKLIYNDDFYLMFQPFISAENEKIVGCEALVRLHRKKGNIMPDNFLDIIQKEKLNLKFDLYVYRKCCMWAKKHSNSNIKITCNFSRATLSHEETPKYIKSINNELKVDFSSVAIEITEDCVVTDFELFKKNIIELKENGFNICLDDFGKAFTSLGDISKLKPDVIKIDKTMLHNADDEQGQLVFENIVQLAKKMNSIVLCEGIETEEQKNAVKAAGCDIMQGYYFYKPMHENEFDELLNQA